MRDPHERMPVVIEEADWPDWLGEGDSDPLALLRPAGEAVVRFWPVSRAVNRVGRSCPQPWRSNGVAKQG